MPPIWVNALASALELESDVVSVVKIRPTRLVIKYRTGLIDYLWFGGKKPRPYHIIVDRTMSRLGSPIPITSVRDHGLLKERPCDYNYLVVGRRSWRTGHLMDRRLAFHRFIMRMAETGYQWRIPDQDVAEEIGLIHHHASPHNIWRGQAILMTIYSWRQRPGVDLCYHFFGMEKIKYSPAAPARRMTDPMTIKKYAEKVVARGRLLSSYTVGRMIRNRYGHRMPYFVMYANLFKLLKARSVYDPFPETGTKALACARLGLTYVTDRNEAFELAMGRGFGSAIGLIHRYRDDHGPADCTIADYCLARSSGDEILEMADRGHRLVGWASRFAPAEYFSDCPPAHRIPVNYGEFRSHFLVW